MTQDVKEIYKQLKHEITTLKIKPGTIIKEEELSEMFKISRTPVRDIIKKLEYDKLITVKPRCKSYVSKINLDGITDIMYIRSKIEYAVCQEAMANFTPGDSTQVRRIIREQENAIKIEDRDERARVFFALDNDYHKVIYSLIGREGVIELLNHSFPFFSRFRYLTYYRHVDELYNLIGYHCEILKCIEEKNEIALKEAVTAHNFSGMVGIDTVIDEHMDYFE